MTLSEASVSWRGMTFGSGSLWRVREISGWQSLPGTAKEQKFSSWAGRGWQDSPVIPLGRTILMVGSVLPSDDRDANVAAWLSEMYLPVDPWTTEQLTISMAGQSLTVDAQLAEASLDPGEGWSVGRLTWSARWECDDPLRYLGLIDQTVSGPPSTAGAGLTPPLTPPVTPAANPAGGAVQALNSGNAPAPCEIDLRGPWSNPGVAIQSTQGTKVVLFSDLSLGISDILTLKTRDGVGLLNGTYRPASAGSDMIADLELPPGTNSVAGLGTPGSGAQVVVRFRPAYF